MFIQEKLIYREVRLFDFVLAEQITAHAREVERKRKRNSINCETMKFEHGISASAQFHTKRLASYLYTVAGY
jgi:hypothetical protein